MVHSDVWGFRPDVSNPLWNPNNPIVNVGSASYVPGFVAENSYDLHLGTTSLFQSFSVSRGQIGAYGPGPTGPTIVQGASPIASIADPGHAHLVWFTDGRSGDRAVVFRKTEGAGWLAVGASDVDAGGYATYEDREVLDGERYGYGLGSLASGTFQITGETWVRIPNDSRLQITQLTPNPAGKGPVTASISVPSGSSARLDVLDIGGRRVLAVPLASAALTRRVVTLPGVERLNSGLYWVQLTQGNRVERAKLCVVR